jgi:hypothetical protein
MNLVLSKSVRVFGGVTTANCVHYCYVRPIIIICHSCKSERCIAQLLLLYREYIISDEISQTAFLRGILSAV